MKMDSTILCLLLLFVLHLSKRVDSDLNSDKMALLEFAASVPHIRNLHWNLSSPVCTSWIGISCLYGSIPVKTIGNLDALRVLSLRANFLSGKLPSDILSIPSLRSIYLQQNNFSGGVEASLSPQLGVLDLSFNSFTGMIPSTLMNLKGLSVLKLEFNSFSGAIPDLDLPKLKIVNMSYNLLSGSIPSTFNNFPESSFIGNDRLCGHPLTHCSVISPSPASSPGSNPFSPSDFGRHIRKLSTGAITAIVVGGSGLLVLLVVVIFFLCIKKKDNSSTRIIKTKASTIAKAENLKSDDFGSGVQESEKNKLVFFQGYSYTFDLEDLLRASAEVLGKGNYGTSYKAVLDESITVVVKRLKEVGMGKKEFEQQMEIVNRIGMHPNVLPLLAYYHSKDEKLLVYEYMPANSLCAALHGNRGMGRSAPLDWDSRLNIGVGAAKGLAHIHSEGGSTKLVHGNIKSSNVLLMTDRQDACIADFGVITVTNCPPPKYRVAAYRAQENLQSNIRDLMRWWICLDGFALWFGRNGQLKYLIQSSSNTQILKKSWCRCFRLVCHVLPKRQI